MIRFKQALSRDLQASVGVGDCVGATSSPEDGHGSIGHNLVRICLVKVEFGQIVSSGGRGGISLRVTYCYTGLTNMSMMGFKSWVAME